MREKKGNYKRRSKKLLKRISLSILLVSALCFLSINCTQYNPALFPGYDILNPGPEVQKNPIRITEDGLLVVNEAFMIYVKELALEIIRLRKLIKEPSETKDP